MIIHDRDKPARSRADRQRQRRPLSAAAKRRIWFGVSAVLLVVAIVAGGLAIRKFVSHKSTSQSSSNRSVTTVPTTYLDLGDQSAGRPVSVKLTAPTSWKVKTDNGSQSKVLDTGDFITAHFGFKPDAPGGTADGDIVLENIQSWMAAATPAGGYGGLTSSAQKSAFINFLKNLRKNRTASQADTKNLVSLLGQAGGFQGLKYVETAGGQLSGVIFETVVTQNGRYQPVIVSYLAGDVGERPLYLRSIVTYQDPTYGDLYGDGGNPTADQVKQAAADFAGGKVDSGMTELAGHFSDLLETFTVDTARLGR